LYDDEVVEVDEVHHLTIVQNEIIAKASMTELVELLHLLEIYNNHEKIH
jgi:hypothetical protein